MKKQPLRLSPKQKFLRVGKYVLLGCCVVAILGVGSVVAYGKYVAYVQSTKPVITLEEVVIIDEVVTTPQFPVGVHPLKEEIIENPVAEAFFNEHFASHKNERHTSWLGRMLGELAMHSWYQNLASVSSRILVIQPGERKEQIASNFKKILGWTEDERAEFLRLVVDSVPSIEEGKFQPGTYTVVRKAKPPEVAALIIERFQKDILVHYGVGVEEVVPLEQALIVASLLEREAYDFEDMRHISGVIWNRLFADMRLQIDATLQYAKGSKPEQPWWPKVVPQDKYIASVFNTYKNNGLPPSAIANPSAEAVLAALNPTQTECMFYFHDSKAGFHCTETYEEHVKLLKEYYGKGK